MAGPVVHEPATAGRRVPKFGNATREDLPGFLEIMRIIHQEPNSSAFARLLVDQQNPCLAFREQRRGGDVLQLRVKPLDAPSVLVVQPAVSDHGAICAVVRLLSLFLRRQRSPEQIAQEWHDRSDARRGRNYIDDAAV